MKKSILTLVILITLTNTTQAKNFVTIYGVINTQIIYFNEVNNKNNINNKLEFRSNNIQNSRIGFTGTENLSAGIKTLFNIEINFINHNHSNNATNNILLHRRSIIGLNGNFGTILLGHQTNFADTINMYTGIADFGNFTSNTGSDLNRLQGTHTNNAISYTTNNLSGFTGSILYGFGETPSKVSTGQAFGIGSKYEKGPLGLGINYYENNTISSFINTSHNHESAKILNMVASYQFKSARIYGNWSYVKQNLNTIASTRLTIANRLTHATLKLSEKANMYEIGAAYKLNSIIKILVSIQHTEADFNGLDGKGNLTQINFGTNYLLSKYTNLYLIISNIRSISMKNPGAIGANQIGNDDAQTAVGIGIKYKF